ncbi:DNA alkylation repair protein [uncultured Lactobacillus sp.]|uniref:DNA alkylation repair protein n=1 Tax=uncultured Lactobacillus sp. TaxID=153152 RepID=UPI00261A8039|nr:DNA alkylation repair protein [uncultured Lactobacillus sp.]
MINYLELKKRFENNKDLDTARHMKAYMRNQFDFYGYQAARRKQVYHQDLLLEKKDKKINWKLLDQAWQDKYREFQYFGCDYLISMQKFLEYKDLEKIKVYVTTKSWWDTTDSLIKPIGKLGLRDKRVNELMLEWSKQDNIWLVRVAIEHQLLRKEKTNTQLLAQIIANNTSSDEFFINKAIGWALRDYSKTNPSWVKKFISDHPEMSDFSVKQASRYLK